LGVIAAAVGGICSLEVESDVTAAERRSEWNSKFGCADVNCGEDKSRKEGAEVSFDPASFFEQGRWP
jgi:hypothetical protein